jgi:hypothetical protein
LWRFHSRCIVPGHPRLELCGLSRALAHHSIYISRVGPPIPRSPGGQEIHHK